MQRVGIFVKGNITPAQRTGTVGLYDGVDGVYPLINRTWRQLF